MNNGPEFKENSLSPDLAPANFTGSKLAELSNLDRDELDSFWKAYSAMPERQRLEIISRLVELAENNVELNFDGIFKLSLKDPDPEIRSQAIEGLWENEETSLISPLLDLLLNDSSDKVKADAANALGRFVLLGEHGKLRPANLDRISNPLMKIINDPESNEEVRRRALEAVSPLSRSDVKTSISEAYYGSNPRLKVSSIYAMGRNCDLDWLPMLLTELKNSDPEIRFEAATSLGELGQETAVPDLIRIAGDPDSEVQLAVIQACGKIGGPGAKEFLQNLLSSRDATVREIARQSLDELMSNEDPLSLQLLKTDLDTHDDD